MSDGRQSSSEVAHEAEDTRAHLASTLDKLRTNLQPENVLEEVVSNARVGAATLADNLVGVAKRYPIPSVLIAAGSALVMRVFAGKGGGGTPFEAPGAVPRGAAAGLGLRPPLLRNPSAFRPAPGRGGSSGGDSREQPADAYDATARQARDTVSAVSRYVPSGRAEVKSKLTTLFEEQPLVLGAIGLAIGAAIGAALPMTETEDGLMGPTAHRFRDSATHAARQEVDELRSAAGEAVDNVRHAAEDSFRTVVDRAGESLSGTRDV